MSFLASAEIETLISMILSGPTNDRASALFDLLKAISDPTGNQDRYECALDALRAVEPLTKEYEAWFQSRISSAARVQQVTA